MPVSSSRACLQSSSDAAFRKSQIEEWRGSMVSLQTRPRTLAQRLDHKGVAEVQRIFAKDMIRAIIFH
jgi:hypothetical protein